MKNYTPLNLKIALAATTFIKQVGKNPRYDATEALSSPSEFFNIPFVTYNDPTIRGLKQF